MSEDITYKEKLIRGYLKKLLYAQQNKLKVEIVRYGTYKPIKGFIVEIEEGGLITVRYWEEETTFSIADIRSIKIYYENNKKEPKEGEKNAEPA